MKNSILMVLVFCLGSFVFTPAGFSQEKKLTPPTAEAARITKIIASKVPQLHVSGRRLNDEISSRALDNFVNTLDPLKLYFYQADIEQFEGYRKKIDDMVIGGDITAAYGIFQRFLMRLDEKAPVIETLLNQPFDFTKDEYLITEPDDRKYAKTIDESVDNWRRKLKYDILSMKADKSDESTDQEIIEKLQRRYKRSTRRWGETDNDDLLEMFLTSVTTGFDPHSTYMSPSTLEDFEISMRLNLDGIGAQLQEKDGMTTITRVIPGGAADKHGKLKQDDVIVSVGQGNEGEMLDIVEMPLSDVVKKIRGGAGTKVRLGVKPGGDGELQIYTIVRARIELEDSAAQGEVIDHRLGPDGTSMRIGYITLPSFYMDMQGAAANATDYRSSTRDVKKILDRFRREGVDGVVLDLSRNGGGSLTEAIRLTGLFIDKGPVVQVKDPFGNVEPYDDEDRGVAWDGPLVVMTTKMSASASEILAGAIRDYERGIVVGDPATHGKGSVQSLRDLGERLFGRNQNLGAMKVTIQKFYLPDGESTQLKGVPADVVVPSLFAKMDIGEGDLKHALDFDRVPRAKHVTYGMTPPNVINELRNNSMKRIEGDDEFKDLVRRIDLFVEQKENKKISLNEEKFMARREELNAQKEEEEELLKQQIGDDEIYNDYFYNREVMSITSDYVKALRQKNLAQTK